MPSIQVGVTLMECSSAEFGTEWTHEELRRFLSFGTTRIGSER
jgi:hypothetical protein